MQYYYRIGPGECAACTHSSSLVVHLLKMLWLHLFLSVNDSVIASARATWSRSHVCDSFKMSTGELLCSGAAINNHKWDQLTYSHRSIQQLIQTPWQRINSVLSVFITSKFLGLVSILYNNSSPSPNSATERLPSVVYSGVLSGSWIGNLLESGIFF